MVVYDCARICHANMSLDSTTDYGTLIDLMYHNKSEKAT